MIVKLLTEQHLEFLSLTGGCTDSSEPTLVKLPHCWKSRVTAQLYTSTTIKYTSGQHAGSVQIVWIHRANHGPLQNVRFCMIKVCLDVSHRQISCSHALFLRYILSTILADHIP